LHQPSAIIVPETAVISKLVRALESLGATIIGAPRRAFNDSDGISQLRSFAISLPALEVCAQNKYYALASASALLCYLQQEHHLTLSPHSVNVEYHACEGTLLIDAHSSSHLELVSCIRKPLQSHTFAESYSLLGVLGAGLGTKMGRRRLRASLLQPLTDLQSIVARQDAVEQLLNSPQILGAIQTALKRLPDLDRLVTSLVSNRSMSAVHATALMLKDLLEVRGLIGSMSTISEILEPCAFVSLVDSIKQALVDPVMSQLNECIAESLNSDLTLDQFSESTTGDHLKLNQLLQAVRPETNGLLAVARQSYTEITNDIGQLVDEYNRQFDFAIKLKFDPKSYVYSMITAAEHIEPTLLPSMFIHGAKRGKVTRFTSMDMIKLNERLNEAVQEILILSNEVTVGLLEQVRDQLSPLHRAADALGLLDMLAALAHYTTRLPVSSKPEFGETLAISGAMHPVKLHHDPHFISNDVYAFEGGHFQILTGANMSGKTTYIKMVALLVVMAQIGCWVPATICTLPVFESVMTRLGQDDDPENNISTFAVEMRDMAYILSQLDCMDQGQRSLILVDELGRGTSPIDGFGICFAVCERLLQSPSSYTFFVTHYGELADLMEIYPDVVNLHLEEEGRKLSAERVPIDHYGIDLAAKSGFPVDVIDTAKHVSVALRDDERPVRELVAEIRAEYAFTALKLMHHLKHLSTQPIEDDKLIQHLTALQAQFKQQS
jgi:DNA mismatch repair protein MSH4